MPRRIRTLGLRTLGLHTLGVHTLGLLALVALAGGCERGARVEATQEPTEPAPVGVTTAPAELIEVPDVLQLEGTLAAFREASLSPLVAGHVSAIELDIQADLVADLLVDFLREEIGRAGFGRADAAAAGGVNTLAPPARWLN